MTIAEYVERVRAYRVARGRMKYFRDTAEALLLALRHDLSGSRIKAAGRAYTEAYPDDGVDGVCLEVWPSGEEIAEGIAELKLAREVLVAAWQSLSDDEQAAAVDPDSL